MKALTSGMSQAFDFSGCSCTKCRHSLSCIAYSSKQNLMCAFAARSSSAIFLASRLALPISWRGEKAVHGGEPIMQNGFVSRTNRLTLFYTCGLLRSQASPDSGSLVVRSKLHPGTSLVPPYVRAEAS